MSAIAMRGRFLQSALGPRWGLTCGQSVPSTRRIKGRTRRTITSHPQATPVGTAKSVAIRPDSLALSVSQRNKLPVFRVQSENIQLLERPQEFYQALLEMVRSARKRLFLASLYLGKSETELVDHIAHALSSHEELCVTILVDGLRSTREGEYHNRATESCASLLAGLKSRFPDRVQIRLFRGPDLPRWLEKLVGKRFVEGWGLQHMKIYGADDRVMISGANLSNDYFTNRRDRYLVLDDVSVSAYLHDLLTLAARYSYSLQAEPMRSELSTYHTPFSQIWDEGRLLFGNRFSENPVGSVRWKQQMQSEVERLTREWFQSTQALSCSQESSQNQVFLVPLLQMGPLNIHHETNCVPQILGYADEWPDGRLDFTTGYFSINPEYARSVLRSRFRSNIITASPRSNGFFGSKGVSRHLPAAYTWLEQQFWTLLTQYGRADKVVLREWNKDGWTYHAKGIWFFPSKQASPVLTLLGSSNFGIRSAQLDLECTMLVDAAQSPAFQRRLGEEVRELMSDANDPVGESMFQRPERKVHWGVKIATRLIRRML